MSYLSINWSILTQFDPLTTTKNHDILWPSREQQDKQQRGTTEQAAGEGPITMSHTMHTTHNRQAFDWQIQVLLPAGFSRIATCEGRTGCS